MIGAERAHPGARRRFSVKTLVVSGRFLALVNGPLRVISTARSGMSRHAMANTCLLVVTIP
jgi:hypothetical protein